MNSHEEIVARRTGACIFAAATRETGFFDNWQKVCQFEGLRRLRLSRLRSFPMVILLGLLALSATAQVTVDRPRVLVVPLANLTGQEQNDVVADTSTDTILLTLRLLDQYEVVAATDVSSQTLIGADPAELDRVSADQGVDNLMFGSVTTTDNGGFRFQLSVYDRAESGISLEAESVSPSLFGVFDAADALVAEAVSGFSGVRIGFGRLQVSGSGEGDYLLYVDGGLIGENVATVDRLLIGRREIAIRQRRGDRETTIYRETVTVDEGSTTTVRFAFPTVTADEIAREAELRQRLAIQLTIGVNVRSMEQAIAELEDLYLRLPGSLEGSIEDIPGYRDRLMLAEDMQQLPAVDLRSLAPLSDQDQRVAMEEIYQPWVDLWQAYGARAEGEASETAEAQYERIRNDVERNLETLAGLITLERALVERQEQWELVDGFNRLRMAARPQNFVELRPHTWPAQAATATTAVREYGRALERERPFWHWIAGAVGLGALGYAGYTWLGDDTATLEQQIEANIAEYEAATDYDQIVSLRSRIESDVDRLNQLQTIPTIAAAGGGVMLSTAVIGRIVSRTRPNRVWRRYREDPVIVRWTAAGLDYRDAAAAAESGSGSAVVILGANFDTFRIGEDGEILRSPQVFETEPGEDWSIEYVRGGSFVLEGYEFTAREGLNVISLGVRE